MENISYHIELYLLYLKPLEYIKHLIWPHLCTSVHLLEVPLPTQTVRWPFTSSASSLLVQPLVIRATRSLGWIWRGL